MNGDTQTNRTKNEKAAMNQAVENDFLRLFCEKFRCSQRKFKKRVFLECVYPHGTALARLFRLVNPWLFKADFDLIEKIKHATSFAEVKRVVDYHGTQNAPNGVIRLILKVRVSKQRLLELAQELFRQTD